MSPIIKPPFDEVEVVIQEVIEQKGITRSQYDYIKSRLNKPTWKCPSCGLVNHYYNERCANFRCKHEKPASSN